MIIKKFRLFENLDNIYPDIQKMIDNNDFLKGKIDANSNTVFEAGDYILLIDDVSHITDSHIDETIPGSKFNKGIDLKKAIISLVSNNKVSKMSVGFGANEREVTNKDDAEKFKWLGVDSKMNVGVENLHKLDVDSDDFKSLDVYEYSEEIKGGPRKGQKNDFKIKVKDGDGKTTTFMSFIGAKLGKIGDKIVLSVMTAFPGQNGAAITDRNEFMKQGYYFTTTNKDVIDKSTKNESFKIKYFSDYLK